MLRHFGETSGVPASEVRVTAEELTAALAAVETNKEQEARLLSETITIGQAILS